MSKFLSTINIYPVKSLGGISLKSSVVEERGLKYDRRWLLIDENNIFFTQRNFPQMALLQPEVNESCLLIKHKLNSLPPLEVPYQPDTDEMIEVTIWDDRCEALPVGSFADEWFSEALGTNCRLVYMPDETRRKTNPQYAEDKIVSFADGFPFLLIGQSSLDNLNDRLDTPVPMDRFRTNLVFEGGKPFEEDSFGEFLIGDMKFKAVKPCARCVITTVDQETADKGSEPLATLSGYRKQGNKVLFGQNLVAFGTGEIKVGDEIKLL